jgi:hypothetical protein
VADGEASASSHDFVTVAGTSTYAVDISSTVQSWSDNPASNFGLVMKSTSEQWDEGLSFYSSEYEFSTTAFPLLTVDFTPPPETVPEPGTMVPLLVLGLAWSVVRRRRRKA